MPWYNDRESGKTMNYDTVVIGAGLSGLAAAIRLAHFGKKVAVFERHHRIGGLNSWYRRGGRLFDTGLHAMTNYAPRDERSAPLNRLLRQLRLNYDALELRPQTRSSIVFPAGRLTFSNDFSEMVAGVGALFPGQLDGFLRLAENVRDYPAFSYDLAPCSTRRVLAEVLGAGPLGEMLLCPMMYYGNAGEHDMDFRQFAILFRSIFLEGFCRPAIGIVGLLDLLAERIRESGGEIHTRSGVAEILSKNGRATAVLLDDGREVACGNVLSCAGRPETLALCRGLPGAEEDGTPQAGRMSFIESILVLDRAASSLGFGDCVSFVNRTERFSFARPAGFVDPRSCVVCVPENFRYRPEEAPEPMVRITSIANYDAWSAPDRGGYADAKRQALAGQLEFLADLSPELSRHVVADDTFTPVTVRRFTGHRGGAVYGSPDKSFDGTTPLDNLFLCGTDQGFLGIVGSLLSGVSIANLHLLK